MAGRSSFLDMTREQRRAFGERVRVAVSRIGVQEMAAAAAGVSLTQLKSWLKGDSAPSVFTLARLARHANVDLHWLVWGSEAASPEAPPASGRTAPVDAVAPALGALRPLRELADQLGASLYVATSESETIRRARRDHAAIVTHIDAAIARTSEGR